MLLVKINQSFIKLIIFIFFNIIFFTQLSFSSDFKDCNHKAFYVKNIRTDVTSDSIIKAKLLAEKQALHSGLITLIKRLTLKKKNNIKFKIELRNLINFIKINNEANSTNRFIASFDICFNRKAIIKLFKSYDLSYAEVYSLPISVLPIFGSPRGYVVFDKNHVWQKLWVKNFQNYDGLLKFKISKANLLLKRNLNVKKILLSEKNEIVKIMKFNKTKRLMTVVSEPVLLKNGNFGLKTYSRLYNKKGEFDSTLYSNLKKFKSYNTAVKVQKKQLEKEIKQILFIFSESWKKNNLFKENALTQVNLYVPIKRKNDWSKFISLVNKLPYVNHFKIISLKNDVGKVRINFQGTAKTFLTILNEKGLKITKVKDEFVLSKSK